MLDYLPDFPWYGWVICALILIIVGLLEGAYREHREMAERLERIPQQVSLDSPNEVLRELFDQKGRISLGLQRNPNALKIIIGSGQDFEEIIPRPEHVARKVLACIENTDPNFSVSNCKITIDVCGGGSYLMVDTFTLNPQERRFFPVALRHEASLDQFIHVTIPHVGGGFFAEAYTVKLPLTGGIITIKATSAETRPAEQVCRLFVDDSGKLRLEKA